VEGWWRVGGGLKSNPPPSFLSIYILYFIYFIKKYIINKIKVEG